MGKHTPGPWRLTLRFQDKIDIFHSGPGCDKPGAASKTVCRVTCRETWLEEQTANALLIAASPDLLAEMLRYLPLLELLENDHDVWGMVTDGTGIATLNGYRHAITKATGNS